MTHHHHTHYVYDCEDCRKEVKAHRVNRCIVCNKRLCSSCKIGEFCSRHFNYMDDIGQEKANSLADIIKLLGCFCILLYGINMVYLWGTDGGFIMRIIDSMENINLAIALSIIFIIVIFSYPIFLYALLESLIRKRIRKIYSEHVKKI